MTKRERKYHRKKKGLLTKQQLRHQDIIRELLTRESIYDRLIFPSYLLKPSSHEDAGLVC